MKIETKRNIRDRVVIVPKGRKKEVTGTIMDIMTTTYYTLATGIKTTVRYNVWYEDRVGNTKEETVIDEDIIRMADDEEKEGRQ